MIVFSYRVHKVHDRRMKRALSLFPIAVVFGPPVWAGGTISPFAGGPVPGHGARPVLVQADPEDQVRLLAPPDEPVEMAPRVPTAPPPAGSGPADRGMAGWFWGQVPVAVPGPGGLGSGLAALSQAPYGWPAIRIDRLKRLGDRHGACAQRQAEASPRPSLS